MIALSIIVSIQTLFIVWLIGRNQIQKDFIKETANTVNYHSVILIEIAIQNAIANENYELAHQLKKKKDNLCN